MINKVLLFLVALVASLVGFLVGKIFSVPVFSFDKSVNLVHLISVLCPVIITIIVAILLDHKKESNKVKRDLILKRSDDLYRLIDDVSIIIDAQSEIPLSDVTSKLKRLSVLAQSVSQSLKAAFPNEKCFMSEFVVIHKGLKNSLTYTDVSDTSSCEINKDHNKIIINDGKCAYGSQRIMEINAEIEKLRSFVFNLQVFISGCR